MAVKESKTKYNIKEIAWKIRYYILEYIQNLGKILADLEKAGITIAGIKSQLYQAYIKIVEYIFDADDCHCNTSKVLKIFN